MSAEMTEHVDRRDAIVIGVAGGSGSGKTAVVRRTSRAWATTR
jgi:uridine kinase